MFFQKLGKSSEITAYYTKYTAVLVNTAKIVKLSAPDGAIRASKNLWTSICLKVIQLNCGVRPKHCDIWGTVIPPMYWTVPEWYTIYPKTRKRRFGVTHFVENRQMCPAFGKKMGEQTEGHVIHQMNNFGVDMANIGIVLPPTVTFGLQLFLWFGLSEAHTQKTCSELDTTIIKNQCHPRPTQACGEKGAFFICVWFTRINGGGGFWFSKNVVNCARICENGRMEAGRNAGASRNKMLPYVCFV